MPTKFKKNSSSDNAAPRDHYQEITNRIVEALETGVKPWAKGWDESKAAGPMAPVNAVTGKTYRGINTVILGMDPRAFETADPRWCSFNQAKDKGWNVRKGEKATTIVFFKKLTVEDEKAAERGEDGTKQVAMLRAYPVFHASQIDGIPPRIAPTPDEAPWTKPEAAQIILTNSRAVIRTGGDRAFYSPTTDHIQLPPHGAFKDAGSWAATALHELGHWTGAAHRLNRDLTGRFGSGAYAQEELRAELGSVFIAASLGIPADIPNHASYMASWIKALKNDKREVFRAAGDAQKIADMALGFHPEFALKMKADAAEVAETSAKYDAKRSEAATSIPASIGARPAFRRTASRGVRL
jgi:antirestriction protein ArdC